MGAAVAFYEQHGAGLIARYEAVDSAAIFAPFADVLPGRGAAVLDAGAGTGRDAAWLAARGCVVTAAEPAAVLRAAGEARHGAAVTWCADALPQLASLEGAAFDFILVNAVWHHLAEPAREAALLRLGQLLRSGGTALISLRQGPGHEGLPVEPIDPEAEIARARAAGFALRRDVALGSQQSGNRAAGVSWRWVLLAQEGGA
ncbi:MAG: class I SAM-dependent methyltransferase [Sulfitobacter sp.]